MSITLWLAFYLFTRGFPGRITLRAIVVLLAISVFFLSAYQTIFRQTVGMASWRAVCLITGMAFWYSVTYQLMSKPSQKRFRSVAYGIYGFAVLSAILILTPGSFIGEEGNALYSAHMATNLPNIVYQIYQFAFLLCTFLNLLSDQRIGLTPEGKYFLVASILPAGKMLYGMIAWLSPNPLPRFIPDLFLFCGVFILGISVMKHQSLIERRTTFQDFPLSAATMLAILGVYIFLALQWGLPVEALASVAAIVILTHSAYDIVREFLERLRIRSEGTFRRQLRQLEGKESALQSRLQEGLNLLCETLQARGGFIAVRGEEEYMVIATKESLPVGSSLVPAVIDCEDVFQSAAGPYPGITWIAPAFDGQIQVAAIALGEPKARLEYSQGDLDLLADVAGHAGTVVSMNNRSLGRVEAGLLPAGDVQLDPKGTDMSSAADEMIASIATSPDPEFVKIVENSLRHFSDYTSLGQSSLADRLAIQGGSHVERGKRLQNILSEAIESFRPGERRPPEPLPRVWYSYAILYDAYVEGVPNREIMARLYISEGTFNRTRRNAIRGLARLFVERDG
jgi:hypothetical protein